MRQALLAVLIALFYLAILGSRARLRAHFKGPFVLSARVFEAGPELAVLPAEVQGALALLGRVSENEYRLSDGMKRDEIGQRMVESAWPKRLREAGPLWIGLTSEPLPSGCALVDTQKGARLARCS